VRDTQAQAQAETEEAEDAARRGALGERLGGGRGAQRRSTIARGRYSGWEEYHIQRALQRADTEILELTPRERCRQANLRQRKV
jgi:hypothetical protein